MKSLKNWRTAGLRRADGAAAGVQLLEEAAAGEIVEIAPGVLRVVVPVPFPPGGVGVLAMEDQIDGRDVWTIVDTGLRSAESIWRDLLAGPLAGRPVGRVIATHHHPDHIGLAGWFQTEHCAELWTTRTAWLYARMLQLDAPATPHPETMRFFARCGYDAAQLDRQKERAKLNFSVLVAPLPPGFQRIAEGDVVSVGGRAWRVLIGHGHAPEHALLYCADENLLIAGDQILPKISPNIGVYPVEPDADPLGDWLESSRALAERLDDDMLVVPGHGAPFLGARTRLGEIVLEHEEALERLEEHLATPRRAVDCFEAMYRRRITAASEGLATVETVAHLNRLVADGRAERRMDPDGAWRWRLSGA